MKYFSFFIASLLLISCSSSKKTGSTTPHSPKKLLCQNIPMQSQEPVIGWESTSAPTQADAGDFKLPSSFDAYSVDAEKLKEYFLYAGKNKTSFSVPMPKPLDCQYFVLENANTMAPELAAKYPGIVSLKGSGASNKSADIRVNFDGAQMKVQIIWDGSVYLVTPVKINDKIIYLVYDKAHTGDVKKPFETITPQNSIRSDRLIQYKQDR